VARGTEKLPAQSKERSTCSGRQILAAFWGRGRVRRLPDVSKWNKVGQEARCDSPVNTCILITYVMAGGACCICVQNVT
jgi:hypothetical protein